MKWDDSKIVRLRTMVSKPLGQNESQHDRLLKMQKVFSRAFNVPRTALPLEEVKTLCLQALGVASKACPRGGLIAVAQNLWAQWTLVHDVGARDRWRLHLLNQFDEIKKRQRGSDKDAADALLDQLFSHTASVRPNRSQRSELSAWLLGMYQQKSKHRWNAEQTAKIAAGRYKQRPWLKKDAVASKQLKTSRVAVASIACEEMKLVAGVVAKTL